VRLVGHREDPARRTHDGFLAVHEPPDHFVRGRHRVFLVDGRERGECLVRAGRVVTERANAFCDLVDGGCELLYYKLDILSYFNLKVLIILYIFHNIYHHKITLLEYNIQYHISFYRFSIKVCHFLQND
jgi:hypothetical protein